MTTDKSDTPEPPEFEVPQFEPPTDPFAAENTTIYPTEGGFDNAGRWTSEHEKPERDWARYGLITLMLLCILSTVWLGSTALTEFRATAQAQVEQSTVKASTLVHTLETEFLKPAEQLVSAMSEQIENNDKDMDRLKALLDSNQFNLKPIAFGVAYKPYAFDKSVRLKSPFYKRTRQKTYELISVDYDYTRPPGPGESFDSRWFSDGIKGTGSWQEPYYGQILMKWIAEYSIPIRGIHPVTGKEEVLGIVYADFALDEVRQMVRQMTLTNLAYGYLVSPQGILVSHPEPRLIGKPLIHAFNPTMSTTDIPQEELQGKDIVARLANGENFIQEFHDGVTGQTSMVVHQQVPNSHWSFAIVMPKESVYAIANENKKTVLWAAIALAMAVVLSQLVLRRNNLEDDQLPWLISILASVLAVFVTILTLMLFWDSPQNNATRLFSVAETLSARGQSAEDHTIIPTGLLIKSLEFPDPDTAAVGGILWQRYSLDDPEALALLEAHPNGIGVIWPDTKLGFESIRPLRSYDEKGMRIKTWRFSVELGLNRNIERFPFDMSELELRMRSPDTTAALLVPDFQAYDILIPEVKPGIEDAIRLNYWDIRSSFFSLQASSYTGKSTTYKYDGTEISDKNKASEIVFRVQMARQSHVTLISYFLPIFIGSIMMFVVLMIPSDRSPSAVFSTLGYGGTIFFIISIFHVNLRNSEGIDSFTYLESYYIMQHVLVMLVSLNGFFLMRGSTPRWTHYRNNIVPKTLYWPSLSVFLAASTLAYFL